MKLKRKVGRPKTKKSLKRVVLLDGVPVGRGRPTTDSKKRRTIVYIPMDECYDISKHGTGSVYVKGLKQYKWSVKRVNIK